MSLTSHRLRVLAFAGALLAGSLAASGQPGRNTYILTSSNNTSGNAVLVFKVNGGQTPSIPFAYSVPTGGKGGASGNAGILQFNGTLGAVANYGSNTVTQLLRAGNFITAVRSIRLAPDCVGPDSLDLSNGQLYIVGANCAESHAWPAGYLDGPVVPLSDNSAGQIAAGKTWAAVTLKSGSVLRLPLARFTGALDGSSTTITLPADTNDTPLGAAFWGDTLGFNPAHSPNSFAIVDTSQTVHPVAGPTPPFPSNAPCWVVKGPDSIWYTGNSPGMAISIFFSDAQGGAFYKSVPVPGVPTDVAVSPDGNWLAAIYTASDGAHIALFSIDNYGGLTYAASSSAVGVASFNGVAFSQ